MASRSRTWRRSSSRASGSMSSTAWPPAADLASHGPPARGRALSAGSATTGALALPDPSVNLDPSEADIAAHASADRSGSGQPPPVDGPNRNVQVIGHLLHGHQ